VTENLCRSHPCEPPACDNGFSVLDIPKTGVENAVPERADGGGHVLQVSCQDLSQQHRGLGDYV